MISHHYVAEYDWFDIFEVCTCTEVYTCSCVILSSRRVCLSLSCDDDDDDDNDDSDDVDERISIIVA